MDIPIEQFGKDHWSTFAYMETVSVDYKCKPDRRRMRCDPNRHPGVVNMGPGGGVIDGSGYPTRLKDGVEVKDHDDWDCVDDLERFGLLKQYGTGMNPIVTLTGLGRRVAHQLRCHKADGGNFGDFNCGPDGEVIEGDGGSLEDVRAELADGAIA